MPSYKNVVVVGAATAGLSAASHLAKSLPESHRLVLIEAQPVAYWPIGALRAAVEPGFEKEVVRDITSESLFGKGSRHVALAGTRVVDLKQDYIVVNRDVTNQLGDTSLDGDDHTRIPIDRVLLTLGSDYGFPARPSTSAKTKEDILEDFKTMQTQIKAAQHFLVIGGGPTGVEFVGEVLERYPEKGANITLVTKGDRLISNGKDSFTSLSDKLIGQLKQKKVNLIFNDTVPADDLTTGSLPTTQTFTTAKGATVKADFVLVGSGGKPNTGLVKSVDPSVLNAKGQITVNPDLSVKSSNPLWQRYFVAGDANDAPVPKTSYVAGIHGTAVAKTIVDIVKAEAKGQKVQTKPVPGPPGTVLSVPLGKSGGATYLMFFTAGSWITGNVKGKTLFLGNFHKFFSA